MLIVFHIFRCSSCTFLLETTQETNRNPQKEENCLIQKEMGQKEVEQKEMGEKEMGEKEMGQKEMGQKEMGQKEMGQKEMGQKEMVQKKIVQKKIVQETILRLIIGWPVLQTRTNDYALTLLLCLSFIYLSSFFSIYEQA